MLLLLLVASVVVPAEEELGGLSVSSRFLRTNRLGYSQGVELQLLYRRLTDNTTQQERQRQPRTTTATPPLPQRPTRRPPSTIQTVAEATPAQPQVQPARPVRHSHHKHPSPLHLRPSHLPRVAVPLAPVHPQREEQVQVLSTTTLSTLSSGWDGAAILLSKDNYH